MENLCLQILDVDIVDRILDLVASPRSMTRVDVAFADDFGRGLRSRNSHARRWADAVGVLTGLQPKGKSELPSVAAMKKAVCAARGWRPVAGGWELRDEDEFLAAIVFFESAAGRSPGIPHVWRPRPPSVATHFDLRFGEDARSVLQKFRDDAVYSPQIAFSTAVPVEIMGTETPFRLQLEVRPMWTTQEDDRRRPSVNLKLEVDLDSMRVPAPGSDDDRLLLSCDIKCDLGVGRTVTSECFLSKFDATGFVRDLREWDGLYRATEVKMLLDFVPTAGGLCHIAELEVRHSSGALPWIGRSWDSEKNQPGEAVRSASWNHRKPSTGLVRLIHDNDNELATDSFSPGTFNNAIALVRRGGGVGFAQKVLAARDAGALGCIVYDGESALGMCPVQSPIAMGLEFNGEVLPDPGILAVLVGRATGESLVSALQAGDVFVRIGVDHSKESMWRLPPDVRDLCRVIDDDLPIHVALTVRRTDDPIAANTSELSEQFMLTTL